MRLALLSHSRDVLQVSVFEACRILQPIAGQPVECNMGGPNDGYGKQEQPLISGSGRRTLSPDVPRRLQRHRT
jgi:hypothetical protein